MLISRILWSISDSNWIKIQCLCRSAALRVASVSKKLIIVSGDPLILFFLLINQGFPVHPLHHIVGAPAAVGHDIHIRHAEVMRCRSVVMPEVMEPERVLQVRKFDSSLEPV